MENTKKYLHSLQADDYNPANFTERFLAYLIDVVPFALLARATIYYLTVHKDLIIAPSAQIKILVIWILIYIVYVSIFHTILAATVGKLILGIRVVDLQGNYISLWQAIVRAIGYFISAIPLYIGYLMPLFNERKRALHDYIASTVVIKVRHRSRFGQGIIFAISLGLMTLLIASWGYVAFERLNPQNIKKIAIAKQHLQYLGELQKIHKDKYGSYTANINRLAEISGDPGLFRKRMMYAFESEKFLIRGDENGYYMAGYAKDTRHTMVEVSASVR